MSRTQAAIVFALGLLVGSCAAEAVRVGVPDARADAQGKKYEYRVIDSSITLSSRNEDLNSMGAQGWKLVGMYGSQPIFERERP